MKKVPFILIIMCMLTPCASAKGKNNVYFCEFGLTGGCGFVLGDVNGTLFNYVQPVGGGFVKYKFNGHWEIKLSAEGGVLGVNPSAESKKEKNMIFGGANVVGEFNFFNFGVERWKEYRSWVTPTLLWGLGFIAFNGTAAATMPMGIGVKLKLSDRMNMGLYWVCSKAFTDKLDYVDDPIGLNAGFWNNRDWYSTAQIYISVNFLQICAPCRNGVKVTKKY
ncbi:MAG: hypothetical protein MJ002_03855 [Paludibacteraceae bacterium]|nr:hypothetical protein [Paludibacteraceae bacterium]